MTGARDAARTHGKSDPVDALAVARAALREPDLPAAQSDGSDREVRLLVDMREALVGEHTRTINRLRWYLHELDPTRDPTARSPDRVGAHQALTTRLDSHHGTVARPAWALVESRDAYARHNCTAPLPVSSSNCARHRLSRTGNRQLNAALHRIALTQARCHPDARALLARRRAGGDGRPEALRVLKRHLSDVVHRALRADATSPRPGSP